jgi:hypothetical protein
MSDRVKFNIGGQIFETARSTLLKYPDSVLAKHIAPPWQPDAEGIYFFDRDPNVFGAVVGFYRTNTLERPPTVSRSLWKAELDYWEISIPPEKHAPELYMNWPFKFGFIPKSKIVGTYSDSKIILEAVDVATREKLNYLLFPLTTAEQVRIDRELEWRDLQDTEIQNEIKVIREAIEFYLDYTTIEVREVRFKDGQPDLPKVTNWPHETRKWQGIARYSIDDQSYIRAVICHLSARPDN